jgi:tRNA pseudouridine55 synthase
LDPNATGVLVIGFNQGTKLLSTLVNDTKEYIADVQFGIETDAYDITGKVIDNKPYSHITLESIKLALEYFKNIDYQQVPPMFSAKKIQGVKLYELARANKTIERKPVLVKINSYDLIEYTNGVLKVRLNVSKGFYVRSFAHDLGQYLNSCATLSELRRTKSGKFDIENSIALDILLKDNL